MEWIDATEARANLSLRLSELSRYPRVARALWLCVALLLSWLHLFVNTLGIRHSDLVLDDSGTWGVARRSLGVVLTLPTEFHSQPPLYYLLLHFLLPISDAPWFLRGISWLFCWLLILFVLFLWHEATLLGRVAFCLIFIFANITPYLSLSARPYGMAAFLTVVASISLLRLLKAPTARRGLVYAVWTAAMLYTMAFEVAVLLAHGLVALGAMAAFGLHHPRRECLRRLKIVVLTFLSVGAVYLPYLALAYHHQYRDNPTDTLEAVLRTRTYATTLNELFDFPNVVYLGLVLLAGLGLAGELGRRNGLVLLWPLMTLGSIAFVHYFIVGRSPIGAQSKYMTPAFLAVCVLASLGIDQLRPVIRRGFWPVLVVLLAVFVLSRYPDFHRYMQSGPDLGPFAELHAELQKHPGKKVFLNDIGYESQRPAYVTRHDPDILYATMSGSGWASAGDNHLTAEYVLETIERHRTDTRCFFYYVYVKDGLVAKTFIPTLENLGYKPTPELPQTYGYSVVGYCRD